MSRRLLILCLLSQLCIAASRPPTEANFSMVVTAQHIATQIGLDVLSAGGNAVDAACAIGYAESVVHPCCGNIGGGGFMLIRLANGQAHFINFRETAPIAATPERMQKIDEAKFLHSAYMKVGVPGTVKGLNYALKKYGTQSLKQIIQPAIERAKNGYQLRQGDVRILNIATKEFEKQSNVSRIFLHNGKPWLVGHQLVQSELASTLSKIAKDGDKAFYHGDIADTIIAASQQNHALLQKDDFTRYTVQELKPISCDYHGYHVITAPLPSGGGITLCQMLNILSGYPLQKFGFHSARATHLTIEAMRHAYADRGQLLGDPDFANNPTEKLITKQYAAKIRQKIDVNKAGDSRALGTVITRDDGDNTTGFVVVDKAGNAVAVTYTINNYFGARVIAGDTGFFLNDELSDFAFVVGKPNIFGLVHGKQNLIAPGKRPLSSMTPTIITKGGKLFMLLSTPGGPTIPTQILGVIQNVIDYGMDLQEAVDAPRFHMQWLPDVVMMEPYAISPDTLAVLKTMGHRFKMRSTYYGSRQWGGVAAIMVDPKTGLLTGAMDSRRPAGLASGR